MDSDRSLADISLDGLSGPQCLDGRSSPTLEQSSNRFSGNEITNSRLDSLEFLILMLGDAVIEEEGEYVSDYLYRGLHKSLIATGVTAPHRTHQRVQMDHHTRVCARD